MRTLIQRTTSASVTVNSETISEITNGMIIFLGIEDADNENDVEYLTSKIINLRIFDDENGVMNKSVTDINGQILVVSQFTLMASTKKGNRPSYIKASKPEHATPLYEKFCASIQSKLGNEVKRGLFGAHMSVNIINDGPVTIWVDSKVKE